jgi:hypothetical protein
MPINTTNLETVINAKVVAASPTTENKDLLLLSKSIEALDSSSNLKPADIGVTVQGYNADLATETSVDGKIANIVSELVDSSPSTLNTIQEISTALGDDANHVATMTTLIGDKINTADPTFTGTLDGAGNDYTNLHAQYSSVSASGTTILDFLKPYLEVVVNGAITLNTSNAASGRMMVVVLNKAAHSVAFGAEVKWPDDTEPTWADSTYWIVSLTAFSSVLVLASAQGYTV